ncbi:MAG: hypothetical protein ACO1NZ_16715 [Adhaeribacter sp.]
MTEGDKKQQEKESPLLTAEQEEILDKYLQNLDGVFENMKASERVQVEIETLHLKRILRS